MLLTGCAAARLLGLDGADLLDPSPIYAVPHSWGPAPDRIRTRRLGGGFEIDGVLIANTSTIARHLGRGLGPTPRWLDDETPLTPLEVVELAVEHLLRRRFIVNAPRQGKYTDGDFLLRQVLHQRGSLPPTESYAETRLVQILRSRGFPVLWRQITVHDGEPNPKRADFLLPFDPEAIQPNRWSPEDGILLEVESWQFHSSKDDVRRDRIRHNRYQLAGFRWLEILASDIERRPDSVVEQIRSLMGYCERAA